MSCEVFCCEVPRLLELLVDDFDGKYLTKLFSLLEQESPLDHYLAGYFEKILEMLFRRMTVSTMAFLNKGGVDLLRQFLNRIDNYSIMQLVQRVMLPHIPFSSLEEMESLSHSERAAYQCDWSFKEETCDLLCSRMLDHSNPDVPGHISDMLITVLQLSPHESLFLSHLCESPWLGQMLEAAFTDSSDEGASDSTRQLQSNVSVASISVMESLISRLCETMNPFEYNATEKDVSAEDISQSSAKLSESVDKISKVLIPFIPKVASRLRANCDGPICGTFNAQSGKAYRRLGSKGLQLVKLVEAIVRLANDDIDAALCSSGALCACIDLMFAFELNSLLHLSVQRIILILIEGGANER
jgi:hypothetical protein